MTPTFSYLMMASSPLVSTADAIRTTLPLFAHLLDTHAQPYIPFDLLLTLAPLDFGDSRHYQQPTGIWRYKHVYFPDFVVNGLECLRETHAFVHGTVLRLLRRYPDLSTCKLTRLLTTSDSYDETGMDCLDSVKPC